MRDSCAFALVKPSRLPGMGVSTGFAVALHDSSDLLCVNLSAFRVLTPTRVGIWPARSGDRKLNHFTVAVNNNEFAI